MGFSEFYGNRETVAQIRQLLAQERLPQAVILSGREGSGKYTLATMIAQAMNCEKRPLTDGLPDFCGQCRHCVLIAQAKDLEARSVEALEARELLSFAAPVSYNIGTQATTADPSNGADGVATGDFNEDGHLDLAVVHGVEHTVTIMLNNGDGTFRTGATWSTGAL